jgi:hypothetical protein
MSEKSKDIGHGFKIRFYTEYNAIELMGKFHTGLIISGPAAPQCKHPGRASGADDEKRCGGGINFRNSRIAEKEGRPMWTVQSWEPLTIVPSIQCKCGGQHGFITNGRYVKA